MTTTRKIALALATSLLFAGPALAAPVANQAAAPQVTSQYGAFNPSPDLIRAINQAYGTQFAVPAAQAQAPVTR